MKMRYLSNTLRIWITPKDSRDVGVRPLTEVAIAKDRWFTSEVEVLTVPVIPDEKSPDEARTMFESPQDMAREPNPEYPGGATALVVINNSPVHAPPNSLATMHASLTKQIAFNTRVLECEDQIVANNAGISDFLMGFDPTKPTFVAVGVGNHMRGVQPICGQLWLQGSRSIPATCSPLSECGTSREAIALS
jgi:hypothetical protein